MVQWTKYRKPWVAGRLDGSAPAPWNPPGFRGFRRRGMACSYVL